MKKFRLLLPVAALFAVCTMLTAQSFAQNYKLRQSKDPIPNRYIVVLEDDAVTTDFVFSPLPQSLQIGMLSQELAYAHDGTIEHVYTSALKGFSVEMSARDAEALSRDPRVKYVEEDFEVFAEVTQTNAEWGLDRIDQRYLPFSTTYAYDTDGMGVQAYIIDSGIRGTHSQFQSSSGSRVSFSLDNVEDGQNGNDCNGHGTHVAGIVGGTTYGVAKNVSLHNLRVLGCDGRGVGSDFIQAIDWVKNNHVKPAVANVSIGMDAISPTVEAAVTNAVAAGVSFTLSAGNDNADACNNSPGGRVPTAIAVGASNINDQRWSGSNWGACVDLFAPGAAVRSAWYQTDTQTATATGTSMAAPHVAGVIARFLQANPTSSSADTKAALLSWVTNGILDETNLETGSLNRLLYSKVSFASPNPAITIPASGVASPYPAEIMVSGATGTISPNAGSVEVFISGFTALVAKDVVIVLQGPEGQALLLQGISFAQWTANDVSYAITDTAASNMPGNGLADGASYKPTYFGAVPVDFPAPGPGTSYARSTTLSSVFSGTNPNGTWKLFIVDGQPSAQLPSPATITSWSLNITTSASAPTPTPTPTPSPTPDPTPSVRTNYALESNGGVTSASSELSGAFPASATNNGDRKGLNWESGGGWHDVTGNLFPDWVQIDFNGTKTIDEIDVFTLQDNYANPSEPDLNMTYTLWGVTAFDVQYWNGSGWVTVPNGSIAGSNKVWTKVTFPAVSATKVRVLVNDAVDGLWGRYSRLVEIEAWSVGTLPTPTPPPDPPDPEPGPRTNFALASNGGAASASSELSGAFPASATNNGDRKGLNWESGGGWHDVTGNLFPDWVQIDFSGTKTIDEIDVFTLQDNYANPSEPDLNMTYTLWGVTAFDVQYWNGSGWVTVPNGSITGSNKVWTKIVFPEVSTTKIRVSVNDAVDGQWGRYSRLVEIEAWGGGSSPTPDPTPDPGPRTNYALATNGGVTSASSELSGAFPASATNNGDRKGLNWESGGGWHDVTGNVFPDWVQIDFNGTKTIHEIDVFTLQDNYANPSEPDLNMTYTLWGVSAFDVEYWNGSDWVTVPNGSISGSNKVWTKIVFPAVSTTKIRVSVNDAVDGQWGRYSRLVEIEAWGGGSSPLND